MRKRKRDHETPQEETVESKEPEAQVPDDGGPPGLVEDQGPPQDAGKGGGAEPEPEADGAVAVAEAPEEAVERLTAELEEQKERYLRLAAEFDNFRKRVERQRSEIRQVARSDVVRPLLETLDNLARVTALEAAGATVEDVIAGVEMVERNFLRELESVGLTRVGVVGERFDPNNHEAVATAPAPDDDQVDNVAAVLQVGYRLAGTLLRPARVQVYVARVTDDEECCE